MVPERVAVSNDSNGTKFPWVFELLRTPVCTSERPQAVVGSLWIRVTT